MKTIVHEPLCAARSHAMVADHAASLVAVKSGLGRNCVGGHTVKTLTEQFQYKEVLFEQIAPAVRPCLSPTSCGDP
jgi:hypothetical protein